MILPWWPRSPGRCCPGAPAWRSGGRKGGRPGGGFLAGALPGVLGVVLLAAAAPGPEETGGAARPAGLARCPRCAELIRQQPRVGRPCQRAVTAAARAGAR